MCVCVCVCVCARARARICKKLYVYMCVCVYVYAAGLHFSVEFHQNEKTDITSPRKRQDNLAKHILPLA